MRTFILAFSIAVPLLAQPQLPIIHSFPSTLGQIGRAFELIGDIDGDGVPEIASTDCLQAIYYVPTPYPCTSCYYPIEQNGIRVFSGRSGALLFSHDDPQTSYHTSTRYQVADAGDLDFDGKPDVAWSYDNELRVMSTQTGAVLRQWSFTGLDPYDKIAVVGMSDADGDGIRDLAVGEPLVSASGRGRVRVYSGTTGAIVRTILEPSPFGGYFGHALVAVDDLNGDGITDIVVGAPYASNGGKCVAYSGATGAMLWTRSANTASVQLGTSLALAGDVNGDGVPDVIAGAVGLSTPGRVLWLSGATGAVLNTVIGTGEWFGVAVGGGHDVNGDGSPDVAVGKASSSNEVSIYSSTGALIHTYQGGTGYGRTAMISPDLNGDGYGEVITSDTAFWGFLRVAAFLGAQPYGTSGGPLLGWTPGVAVPSAGQLTVTGATPLGPGVIAVSASWAAPSGAPPALIYIALANLILIQPVSFDAAGAYAIPLDLNDPALGGLPFYLQAADFAPSGVTTSNALQLLFN